VDLGGTKKEPAAGLPAWKNLSTHPLLRVVILNAAKDMFFVVSEEKPKHVLRCAQDDN
jgi:hypothetical protein